MSRPDAKRDFGEPAHVMKGSDFPLPGTVAASDRYVIPDFMAKTLLLTLVSRHFYS